MTDNITKIAAIVAIILALISMAVSTANGTLKNAALGAVGTLPIENYIPAIMQNDGYYSAKAITTTSDINASDLTLSGGNLTVTTSNSATSTVVVGCVQMYATSTASPWRLQVVASSTQIAPGYNGLMLAQYGSCPF